MTVLSMPLSLGVEGQGRIIDVEALVRRVVDDRLRQWGARLREIDHEDLVSYLIGVCWELSGRYDPAKDKKPNFGAYAAKILTLRVADWYRQRFGDTRHGDRPVVLSLDAPASLDGAASAEGADRLVDTIAASGGDPANDRSPDLVGVLERGRSDLVGADDALGEPPAGRTAKGTRRTVSPRVPGTYRAPRRPPVCPPCFKTFRDAFVAVNAKLTTEVSEDELLLKAAARAQAVRFGDEWACPRCTKLSDEKGQELMLQSAYPNRASRRAAAKQARSKR